MARGIAMIVMVHKERPKSKGSTNNSAVSYYTESVVPTLGARYTRHKNLQELISTRCIKSQIMADPRQPGGHLRQQRAGLERWSQWMMLHTARGSVSRSRYLVVELPSERSFNP